MGADASFWNRIASDYAKQPVADPAAFERKIAITQGLMGPEAVVLDVGCGTGSLALRLASGAGQVHGLDGSDAMIHMATNKAREQQVENISFHVGAFDDSFNTLSEGSVDVLCAYSLLHLLEDRVAALARIQRLLKPGGWFVSSTVCLAESWIPFAPLIQVMRWLGKAPMVKSLSKDSLAREIQEAGFVDLSQPDVGAKPIVAFMVARKPG